MVWIFTPFHPMKGNPCHCYWLLWSSVQKVGCTYQICCSYIRNEFFEFFFVTANHVQLNFLCCQAFDFRFITSLSQGQSHYCYVQSGNLSWSLHMTVSKVEFDISVSKLVIYVMSCYYVFLVCSMEWALAELRYHVLCTSVIIIQVLCSNEFFLEQYLPPGLFFHFFKKCQSDNIKCNSSVPNFSIHPHIR